MGNYPRKYLLDFIAYLILIPILIVILLYCNKINLLEAYMHDNPSDYLVWSLLLLPFILTIIKHYYSRKKNLEFTLMFITFLCLFYYIIYHFGYDPIVDDARRIVIMFTIGLMVIVYLLNLMFTLILEKILGKQNENKQG